MKKSVLTAALLGLISFGASATQYGYHGDNADKTGYQLNVSPFTQRDHDESVTMQRSTELRKQALSKVARNVNSTTAKAKPFTQRDHDESVTMQRSAELRKQALSKSARNVKSFTPQANPFTQRDHDESVTMQRSAELRKQALS